MTNKGKIHTMAHMTIKTSQLILKDSFMISPFVKHFVFSCQDDAFNEFIPGQFITMHLPSDNKILRRSYSIANQTHTGEIEFAAGYVKEGPASEKLFSLQPGDEITANGPFGRLILKEEPVQRYLLIATSTGVTPYRSMLNALSKKMAANPELHIHILQGIRERQDTLYPEDFLAFANAHTNAHFHACYSREKHTNLKDFEYIGYVQEKLKSLNPNHESDIAYLCGNPTMVDACHAELTNCHFDIKQIRREKYISR